MSDTPAPPEENFGSVARYWVVVWCGVVAGGALFGAMLLRSSYFGGRSAMIGAGLGAVFAGLIGFPVTSACASTARAIRAPRSRLLAVIAGMGTGAISSIALRDGILPELFQYLAGLVGAAGATLAAWNYRPRGQTRPRITIAYLLVHTGCLAVLVAAWRLLCG